MKTSHFFRCVCAAMAFLFLCVFSACAEEKAVTGVVFHDGFDTVDNNRVFYEIFVSSFSDSDGDGIGDLKGILNRLDYLNDGDPQSGKSLGVEGLWLTPVFSSPSYHKYDVTDYYTIDPSFGTMEDLKALVDACHERGMLLILDMPINHTGKEHRWFTSFRNAHRTQNDRNPYYDFYVWAQEGDSLPAGRHFARVPGSSLLYEANFADSMPELNFDNEEVRKAMLDVALCYLDLGVDGFRFDAAKYIYLGDNARSVDFWRWYTGELKKVKPDVYTVAEVWDGDGIIDQYLPVFSCFNFTLSQVDGLIADTAKGGNANRFTAVIRNYLDRLEASGGDARATLFIANHDTDRAAGYLTVASGMMKMAANLYILSPGSPFIYYGEEIGLRGSRGGANTDANRRLAMLWGDGDTVQDPPGTTYNPESQTPYTVQDLYPMGGGILQYYKRLLMLRKANPEIARGTYEPLQLEGTKVGGFRSTWNGSSVVVLHNPSKSDQKLDLAAAGLDGLTLEAVIGQGEVFPEDGILWIEGLTSVILR